MVRFLVLNIPMWALGLGCVAVAVALSLCGLVFVRRSAELRRLREFHDVAGFLIAIVGVIYAVLLGFVVVVVWEQFGTDDTNVSAEAAAIGNLYRDAVALGPAATQLRRDVDVYATNVVCAEWPYMSTHQSELPGTEGSLNLIWGDVTHLSLGDAGTTTGDFVKQAVGDVAAATDARRTRLRDSASEIPSVMWVVLIVGAFITVGFSYFFGLDSFRAQAVMVSSLATLIGLSLFVVLSLNLPFSGSLAVKPEAIVDQIREFDVYDFSGSPKHLPERSEFACSSHHLIAARGRGSATRPT